MLLLTRFAKVSRSIVKGSMLLVKSSKPTQLNHPLPDQSSSVWFTDPALLRTLYPMQTFPIFSLRLA